MERRKRSGNKNHWSLFDTKCVHESLLNNGINYMPQIFYQKNSATSCSSYGSYDAKLLFSTYEGITTHQLHVNSDILDFCLVVGGVQLKHRDIAASLKNSLGCIDRIDGESSFICVVHTLLAVKPCLGILWMRKNADKYRPSDPFLPLQDMQLDEYSIWRANACAGVIVRESKTRPIVQCQSCYDIGRKVSTRHKDKMRKGYYKTLEEMKWAELLKASEKKLQQMDIPVANLDPETVSVIEESSDAIKNKWKKILGKIEPESLEEVIDEETAQLAEVGLSAVKEISIIELLEEAAVYARKREKNEKFKYSTRYIALCKYFRSILGNTMYEKFRRSNTLPLVPNLRRHDQFDMLFDGINDENFVRVIQIKNHLYNRFDIPQNLRPTFDPYWFLYCDGVVLDSRIMADKYNEKIIGLVTEENDKPVNIDSQQEVMGKTADNAYLFVLSNMLDTRMTIPLAVIMMKGKNNSDDYVTAYNRLWRMAKQHNFTWRFITFDADPSTLALRNIIPEFDGFIGQHTCLIHFCKRVRNMIIDADLLYINGNFGKREELLQLANGFSEFSALLHLSNEAVSPNCREKMKVNLVLKMCRPEVIAEARRAEYHAIADMLQILRDLCDWAMDSRQLRSPDDFTKRKTKFEQIKGKFNEFQKKSTEKEIQMLDDIVAKSKENPSSNANLQILLPKKFNEGIRKDLEQIYLTHFRLLDALEDVVMQYPEYKFNIRPGRLNQDPAEIIFGYARENNQILTAKQFLHALTRLQNAAMSNEPVLQPLATSNVAKKRSRKMKRQYSLPTVNLPSNSEKNLRIAGCYKESIDNTEREIPDWYMSRDELSNPEILAYVGNIRAITTMDQWDISSLRRFEDEELFGIYDAWGSVLRRVRDQVQPPNNSTIIPVQNRQNRNFQLSILLFMMKSDTVENELARNIDAKERIQNALIRGNTSFFLQFALPGYKLLAMARDDQGRWLEPSQRKVLLRALEAIPLKTAFEALVAGILEPLEIGDLVTEEERAWAVDNLRRKLVYRMWSVYFCSATTTIISKLRTKAKEVLDNKKRKTTNIQTSESIPSLNQVPNDNGSTSIGMHPETAKSTKNRKEKRKQSTLRNKGGVRNRFRAERQRK